MIYKSLCLTSTDAAFYLFDKKDILAIKNLPHQPDDCHFNEAIHIHWRYRIYFFLNLARGVKRNFEKISKIFQKFLERRIDWQFFDYKSINVISAKAGI